MGKNMSLGDLAVNLEANIANFTRNLERAGTQTEQAMNRIQGAVRIAGTALAALGIGASAGGLAMLIKGAIDAADNLRDMSQKTGIAVESLNGLGFAAGQAGGSLESMVAAAGKLNKTIAAAGSGDKAASDAFAALGISALDSAGNLKKADVVMAEVADQFAKYQDGPEKAALALALFGKAGADMIPLLNDGGDAMRANIDYAKQYSGATTELSNASDNFNDTMGKMALQQKGFINAMAAEFLPIMQRVAEATLGAAEQSNKYELAAKVLSVTLKGLVLAGSEVAFIFNAVGTVMGGVAAINDAMIHGNLDGMRTVKAAMLADLKEMGAAQTKFTNDIINPPAPKVVHDTIWTAGKKGNAPRLPGPGAPTPKGGKPRAGKPSMSDADKLDEQSKRMVEGLRRQAGALGLTGAALLQYEMSMDGVSEAYQRQAMASQTQIDAWQAEDDASKKRAESQQRAIEDATRETESNAANVESIRVGLLSEADAEQEAHGKRLAELALFHDAKFENEAQANALMEAEVKRHEQAKAEIQASNNLMSVAMAGDTASALYGVLKQAGAEQSALGRALFAVSKALAVAEIIMNTEVAASKAGAQLGIFGLPMAAMIRVTGYASAAIVAGQAIASAEGGYDVPAGVNPMTQLHEKEMVLPKGPADVIRGLAARGGAANAPNVTYAPVINIDSRSDQAQVRQLVSNAVQQGNAQLVDKLQRAGAI